MTSLWCRNDVEWIQGIIPKWPITVIFSFQVGELLFSARIHIYITHTHTHIYIYTHYIYMYTYIHIYIYTTMIYPSWCNIQRRRDVERTKAVGHNCLISSGKKHRYLTEDHVPNDWGYGSWKPVWGSSLRKYVSLGSCSSLNGWWL